MTQKYDDNKVHCPPKGRPEVATNVTKGKKGKVKKSTTKTKAKANPLPPAPNVLPSSTSRGSRASSRLAAKKK